MELRRPRLADKATVLEMMAEFENSQSAHDGGFWDTENFVYEEWLETNMQKEMGINLPENRVPSIQFVSFDDVQGLQVAKEKNIKKALVTCSVNNPASRAVILANGGLIEDVRDGVERYWIGVANE